MCAYNRGASCAALHCRHDATQAYTSPLSGAYPAPTLSQVATTASSNRSHKHNSDGIDDVDWGHTKRAPSTGLLVDAVLEFSDTVAPLPAPANGAAAVPDVTSGAETDGDAAPEARRPQRR